eukprot:1521860-Pleurochrysis_carterae.AAC.2
MNGKTAHRDFPKAEMLREVEEIKGKSERRGIGSACRAARQAGRLRAAVHLRHARGERAGGWAQPKGPTATWRVQHADERTTFHSLTTRQPHMHDVCCSWMNIVTVHNKLRQGVCSMTMTCGRRSSGYSAISLKQSIVFWEVDVFEALVHFYPSRWDKLGHREFRDRLP